MVFEAVLLAPLPGLLARFVLPRDRRGIGLTLLASLIGWLLGYALFHELMGFHELHAFEPEGVLPGTAGAVLALLVIGRSDSQRRERIFTRR